MSVKPPGSRWYNTVWRWHFYAGMLCVPFILWLAATGAVYAWRPQIEAWLDAPYHRLQPVGAPASPSEVVRLAQAAVPGRPLSRYQLPGDTRSAAEVVLGARGDERRVFVDPYCRRVIGIEVEAWRPMVVLFHLHGELMAGAIGSYLVELAACWAVVMILTGLFLWWPRGGRGMGGIVYPRLRGGGQRRFWRDLHAVTGVWASVLALFLITTGLPWAKAWGSYLGAIRTAAGATDAPGWTIGGKPAADPHAGHGAMAGIAPRTPPAPPSAVIDRMVATAARAGLPAPVVVGAPSRRRAAWTASTESHDRTIWRELRFDPATGAVTATRTFAQRHWIDRLVGYGATIHEGALFGILNQLLSTLAAALLALLAASGAVMWWRRRPPDRLGAPVALSRPRATWGLAGAIAALAIAMPLFGASLLAMAATERWGLRRLPGAPRWLGLAAARRAV